MNTGLTGQDLELMISVFKRFSEIEEVLIFGSRAIGNFKKGSDVDLSLKGHKINMEIVSKVSSLLNEELPLPYQFDVGGYDLIDNNKLKEHIDKCGKPIFCRQKNKM